MITDKTELDKAVRSAMHNSGLTIRKISEETGISRPSVGFISKDSQKASLEMLMKLADYFQIKYRFETAKKISKKIDKKKKSS